MKKIVYIVIFSILLIFTFSNNSYASSNERVVYERIDLTYSTNFRIPEYYNLTNSVQLRVVITNDMFINYEYFYDIFDSVFFHVENFNTGRNNSYNFNIQSAQIRNGNELHGTVYIPKEYFYYYIDNYTEVTYEQFFIDFLDYINDLTNYFKFYVRIEYRSKYDYLREYFYRMPPKTRPANLYYVGMAYTSGTVAAGRLYWWLDEYIDISNYVDEYKAFLSYTFVDDTYLYRLFFFDENQNQVATVFMPDYEEYIYKFDNENRHVVGMLHFKDAYTNEYINFDNVKYMQFEYHTEPYPDSSVLINLTNTIDISIGEFWRTAEAFNSYYQAGYNEGNMIGFAEGQEKIRSEIADMLKDEYDRGYEEGLEAAPDEAYERGYIKGANESFIGTMDKWLVPAIIIVMLLGGFFTIARKKQEGDI